MSEAYGFGYPSECESCRSLSSEMLGLQVEPYYREGQGRRLMLIGQDPTIARKPERVTSVLMLDQPNGQLTRWLTGIIGPKALESLTVYATNVVKCSFSRQPSASGRNAHRFLEPFFANCKSHLAQELRRFKPDCVLTLGEPAHKLFVPMLSSESPIACNMKEAFTGRVVRVASNGVHFDYSPCLHIQTFRVAETYGESVREFKAGIAAYLGRD